MLRQTSQLVKKSVPAASAAASGQIRLVSYTERQAKLGRPVSPHVEIYAMPVVALSSITNRITGMALSAGFGGAAALAAVGADVPALIHSAQACIPFFAPLSKFAVAFPIAYHTIGGIRHLVRTCINLHLMLFSEGILKFININFYVVGML